MTAQTTIQHNETNRAARGWVGGAILIVIGGLALLAQYVTFDGRILLPILAAIFLASGVYARKIGLVVPGGIIAGVGLSAYLIESPFAAASDATQGAVGLFGFAAGWALISLFSYFTNAGHHLSLWPLIPGGIMAALGAALLVGGPVLNVLNLMGKLWPVFLIAAGVYTILRRKETTD